MTILIAGMHRSGTSMVAHLLKECGVYLGPEEQIKNAAPDNPDGFWEHPEFVNINNQILAEFDGGWDLVPEFPAGWETSERVEVQRGKARQLIAQFEAEPTWGWKDPRTSLTLPFWKSLLPDIKLVVVLRNPASVARSLERRGFSSLSFGSRLWLNYYQKLMGDVSSQDYIVTHYDAYFIDPQAELRRVLGYLGMPATDEMISRACSVVNLGLRNNPTSLGDLMDARIAQDVIEMYMQLCTSAGSVYQIIAGQEWQDIETGILKTNDPNHTADIRTARIQYLQRSLAEISQRLLDSEKSMQQLSTQIRQRDLEAETLHTQIAAYTTEKDRLLQSLQSLNEQQQADRRLLQSNLNEMTLLRSQLTEQAKEKRLAEERVEDRERAIRHLKAQLAERQTIIQARDQGIAWLREELRLSNEEVLRMREARIWKLGIAYREWRERLARFTFPLRHPIQWTKRILPEPVKRPLRALLGHTTLPPQPAPVVQVQPAADPDPAPGPDFYETLVIQPNLPEEKRAEILLHEADETSRLPDVVCFSIIDWSFRYQRPQQMMSQFAAHGHRVFYICISEFLAADASPRVVVREIKENVHEIVISVQRPPNVYGESMEGDLAESILASLDELRHTYHIEQAISYVMIASWGQTALETRTRWGWQVIYDCMDEWNNFPLIERAILDAEQVLVQECDLLVVTSQRLYDTWSKANRPMVLARNATDYEFYSQRYRPNQVLTEIDHPVVGYYGAIAEWFDVELMTYVAKNRPDYTFVLLGGVFDVDVSELKSLPNVRMLGQQPYELMPHYLYHFDACLIPFKLNPITEATDPVKVYEYLCGGKPVVSVALPELFHYRELLYIADSREDFLAKLDQAVVEDDKSMITRRIEYARQNDWSQRYDTVVAALRQVTPKASIVIVTYNNLALTKLCLESLLRNTKYPSYEIIVVDNNSHDGTQSYLRYMASRHRHIRTILNTTNNGFAKANNQGIALSTGEYLVLLNNDTIVPPGWLRRLVRHLHDPEVGMVGPTTNFVGNEAKIDAPYSTWNEMEEFARAYTWANESLAAEIHMLAMFCVAFRRDVYQTVGPLDERFGVGMFEDDDYSHRVKQEGYRVLCVQDVFVHHFGQAAFGKLIEDGSYDFIFEENKRRYELKWNVSWVPHVHRPLTAFRHAPAVGRPKIASLSSKPTLPPAAPLQVQPQAEDEYAQKLQRENLKWGDHLKVQASGQWNAWLDHPLITQHYQQRAAMDGLRWEEWIRNTLGGPAAKSFDLGCGAADRSLFLWETGSTQYLEGMDISEDRVAEGERRREALGAPGKFRVGDANKLILPADSYDLIFSCQSFHHFVELEAVMEQVSRALTPRGFFVLEEFVGPTQFQWTDLQLKLTQELLAALPESLRMYRHGILKAMEGRPTPQEVMAASPFESIRSAEIWPLFQKYFDVVTVRKLGGTIQHLLYNGIIHNFDAQNPGHNAHIQHIFEIEDRLVDSGELPSDFMLMIGRRKAAD